MNVHSVTKLSKIFKGSTEETKVIDSPEHITAPTKLEAVDYDDTDNDTYSMSYFC